MEVKDGIVESGSDWIRIRFSNIGSGHWRGLNHVSRRMRSDHHDHPINPSIKTLIQTSGSSQIGAPRPPGASLTISPTMECRFYTNVTNQDNAMI